MTLDASVKLGQGIAFPPRISQDRRVAFSDGLENVKEAIRIILLTEPGERVMMPEFGGGLRRFLFRPNTVATHRLIEEEIRRALGRWEPRIRVQAVDVRPDNTDPHLAIANIRFELVAVQTIDEIQVRVALE